MSINQWPARERPRERLTQYGASALSDAELLAILIRHGGKGYSAVDVARKLLHHFNGLRGILTAGSAIFCAEPGLGPAKYCQLQAAAELGKRCLRENLHNRQSIQYSKDAEEFIIARSGMISRKFSRLDFYRISIGLSSSSTFSMAPFIQPASTRGK